jgi:hypothetical protein
MMTIGDSLPVLNIFTWSPVQMSFYQEIHDTAPCPVSVLSPCYHWKIPFGGLVPGFWCTPSKTGAKLRPELQQLYDTAWDHATDDERQYLHIIRQRIDQGSLAELVARRYKKEQEIIPVLGDLAMCLKNNSPYSLQ